MPEEYHAHFNHSQAIDKLFKLLLANHMPRSKYFRVAAQRLLTDKEFRELKEPNKQKYINR
jgi:hypothetical protein